MKEAAKKKKKKKQGSVITNFKPTVAAAGTTWLLQIFFKVWAPLVAKQSLSPDQTVLPSNF